MATKGTAEREPRAASRTENGVKIPAKAVGYHVLRAEGAAEVRCAVHHEGMRVDSFDLGKLAPSVDLVRKLWGSGRYRFAWKRPDGASSGYSTPFEVDDAACPQKPSYAKPPTPPPAPAAPTPPVVPPGSGLVPGGEMLALLAFQDELMRRRAEDDDRRREREREEFDRRLAREREDFTRQLQIRDREAEQSVRRTNAAWAQTVQMMRQAQTPPTDPRLEELVQRVEELSENGNDAGDEDVSKMLLSALGPTVIAKLAASLTPNGAAPEKKDPS